LSELEAKEESIIFYVVDNLSFFLHYLPPYVYSTFRELFIWGFIYIEGLVDISTGLSLVAAEVGNSSHSVILQ